LAILLIFTESFFAELFTELFFIKLRRRMKKEVSLFVIFFFYTEEKKILLKFLTLKISVKKKIVQVSAK